jgi:hypothetical protein
LAGLIVITSRFSYRSGARRRYFSQQLAINDEKQQKKFHARESTVLSRDRAIHPGWTLVFAVVYALDDVKTANDRSR